MNELLLRLGVSNELQAFFKTGELPFSYGNEQEIFAEGFHYIPTGTDIWTAGGFTASEVIITYSVMEAIAYLTLNRDRNPQLTALEFIALGNLPQRTQLDWIRYSRQKRKITLVFGHDLAGRLADIFVATGIRNKSLSLRLDGEHVIATYGSRIYTASPETLSLNAFEKATGMRTGIRTCKPNIHNTFLDQMIYDANP